MDGTDVMYMAQNIIPYMWQVEFANVLIEGGVVDSYVNSFFDCSSSVMPIPSYHLKVLHRSSVACYVQQPKFSVQESLT